MCIDDGVECPVTPFDLPLCECATCGRREIEPPLLESIEDVARAIADLAAEVRRAEGALVQGVRREALSTAHEREAA
jgi:hypothetical protein